MTTTHRTDALADVIATTGLTYRQVDHWCRTGLLFGQPRVVGSGRLRTFTDDQARVLRYAAELVRFGLTPAVALPLAHDLARGVAIDVEHGPCTITVRPREVTA